MKNISKGDKILNINTNVEYVVDVVETYGNTIVVFTEGVKSICLPISSIIKIPKSWLANHFLKTINKSYISDFEEKKFDEDLSRLKLIKINKFDPSEFDKMIKEQDLRVL
jgi:hypothetical protein